MSSNGNSNTAHAPSTGLIGIQFLKIQDECDVINDSEGPESLTTLRLSTGDFLPFIGNHAFVSHKAFAEIYNGVFDEKKASNFYKWQSLDLSRAGESGHSWTGGMSGKVAVSAFINGELENELFERNMTKDVTLTKTNTKEEVLAQIDILRRNELYEHECSENCRSKGCEKLRVIDACWKLNMFHCMMAVPQEAEGYPLLSLPNVCTREPKPGSVFCSEHHELLAKHKIPLKKNEFLKHVGCKAKDSSKTIEEKVIRFANELSSKDPSADVGLSATKYQGTTELVQNADPQLWTGKDDVHSTCNKDIGQKGKLRQRSRGHFMCVTGGGHIMYFNPLFKNTLPVLMQWITTSSMPFVWDDPTTSEEVGQLAVDLGNGAVRGKANEIAQIPLTGCLVTANFDLATALRHHSRLSVIKMVRSGDKQVGSARSLEEKARLASSALPILLQEINSVTVDEIDDITRYLQTEVSADVRTIEGLSLPLAVANKVLEVSDRLNYREDLQGYIDSVQLPYMRENQPQTTSIEKVVQDLLDFPLDELKTNVEVKGEIRIRKTFLMDSMEVGEDFFQQLSKAGGKSAKVCRFHGSTVRVTSIPSTLVTDGLIAQLTEALTQTPAQAETTNHIEAEALQAPLVETRVDELENENIGEGMATETSRKESADRTTLRRGSRRLRTTKSLIRDRLRSRRK